MTTRVGVVGAGVTGLALTHYLAERGVDVVAFEADAEPGGVVRSGRIDGAVVEYGPQRVRLSPAVAGLASAVGLEDELVVGDDDLPLYVYADGSLGEVPRSLSTFLRTDLLSRRGKLRVLAEPFTGAVDPEERVRDLFERKFGVEAYRNVLEPLFGGIYGSDPAAMPAKYALERLVALEGRKGSLLRAAAERAIGAETPPPASFDDGLQALPAALYDAHRPYVHLRTPVDAVRGGTDEGYVLEAGGRSVPVDRVVVTVPAPGAAALLESLAGASVDPLRRLRYNSPVVVHLRAVDADLEGFGYQVGRAEPLATRGVTWNGGLFDRDGVYTAFLSGARDPAVVDGSDEEAGAVARREFRTVTGVDADVLAVTRLREVLPAYDASWSALEAVELPAGVTLATNYTGRVGVPGRIREAKRVADRIART